MVEEEEMSTDPGEVKVEPEIRRRRVQQRGWAKKKKKKKQGEKGNPSRSRRPIRREPGRRRKVEKR
jgi:hypothetical protein